MELTLSLVATITSSAALICVAIGLILQARQLKASQVQIIREMQLELLKLGIDNPELIASVYENEIELEHISKSNLINLTVKFLEAGYSLKMFSRESVTLQTTRLFSSEYPRAWWTLARGIYDVEAQTGTEKEFFTIVDSSFQQAMQALQSATIPEVNPSSEDGQ